MSDENEPVGSLTEEAARLAEALQGWAHDHGFRLDALGDQIAVDSAECRLCPLCRAIARLREAGPDAYGHLADAASSLMLALRSFATPPGADDRRNAGGVEHIDITSDEEDGWG